jgi:hypothetical protein
MVDKTTSGNYEATLLEFGLVSWSESENEAIKSLVKQTCFYILSVMENSGFDRFVEETDNRVMDDYRRRYRKIEFSLARRGRDLSREMDSKLMRAIKNMLSEETMEIIRKTAKNNA